MSDDLIYYGGRANGCGTAADTRKLRARDDKAEGATKNEESGRRAGGGGGGA